MRVGGKLHALAALPSGKRPVTHCIGVWVGPRAGLDGCGISRPHRDIGTHIVYVSIERTYTLFLLECGCFRCRCVVVTYVYNEWVERSINPQVGNLSFLVILNFGLHLRLYYNSFTWPHQLSLPYVVVSVGSILHNMFGFSTLASRCWRRKRKFAFIYNVYVYMPHVCVFWVVSLTLKEGTERRIFDIKERKEYLNLRKRNWYENRGNSWVRSLNVPVGFVSPSNIKMIK
jgi:hypothetical protein